jgi:hypothetical protein
LLAEPGMTILLLLDGVYNSPVPQEH